MRVPALSILLIALALFASACAGGPQDSDKRLADACERQMEEVAEDEGSTPTAKSSKEKLEDTTIVECSGQKVKVVPADEEGDDKNKDTGKESGPDEDPGSGGDEAAPAKLDPAARELFAKTCGSCHTLSDAETSGTFGPNLDDTSFDAEAVRGQIEHGGGGMPGGLLDGDDADSVATYVAGAAAAE
jgi:cytochrome c551